MLGVFGVITAGLVNASYFASASYLSYVWGNGDQERVQKYFNRFVAAWLIVVVGTTVYYLH